MFTVSFLLQANNALWLFCINKIVPVSFWGSTAPPLIYLGEQLLPLLRSPWIQDGPGQRRTSVAHMYKSPKKLSWKVWRPRPSLFRWPCRVSSGIVMQPAVLVEPRYSARLFLALQTELPLVVTHSNQLHFHFPHLEHEFNCETNDPTAHFINLSNPRCAVW